VRRLTSLKISRRRAIEHQCPRCNHVWEELEPDAAPTFDELLNRYPEEERYHAVRVATSIILLEQSEDIYAAAAFHDLVEDQLATLAEIALCAGAEVARIVERVTRRDEETYSDFILRVSECPKASRVKYADLLDNIARQVLHGNKPSLLPRYLKAIAVLAPMVITSIEDIHD